MSLFKKILAKIDPKKGVDWDEVEALLIQSDLGPKLATQLIDELQNLGKQLLADDIQQVLKKYLSQKINPSFSVDSLLKAAQDSSLPIIILVVGVNGTGKTTSSAKLAYLLKQQGKTVAMAAADTFRAGATQQLIAWGQRLDIPVFTGALNSDPSAVCYQAHQQAITANTNFLICDTAGRLHTQHNLMEELKKIKRILGKQDKSSPHFCYMVADAGSGNNAVNQARSFSEAIDIDGIILSKADGSGKGGVAINIYQQFNIPTCFLGTGEEPDTFMCFDQEFYLNGLV